MKQQLYKEDIAQVFRWDSSSREKTQKRRNEFRHKLPRILGTNEKQLFFCSQMSTLQMHSKSWESDLLELVRSAKKKEILDVLCVSCRVTFERRCLWNSRSGNHGSYKEVAGLTPSRKLKTSEICSRSSYSLHFLFELGVFSFLLTGRKPKSLSHL